MVQSTEQFTEAGPVPRAAFHVHLEPNELIEVSELTAALGSLSRQYQAFATSEGATPRAADAKLLVSSIRPGSIDIALVPDLASAAGIFVPLFDNAEHLIGFGKHIFNLVSMFRRDTSEKDRESITLKDCDDATNIVRPIAQHGGVQKFTVIKGDVTYAPVLVMDAAAAMDIQTNATQARKKFALLEARPVQGVSLVFKRMDTDITKTDGNSSPDKGIIPEIDPKPKAIIFTSDMVHIKKEMLGNEANPYLKVYFVDVEASKIGEKVVSYRVVGFHGKDDLPDAETD